jgi:hypothetical protein
MPGSVGIIFLALLVLVPCGFFLVFFFAEFGFCSPKLL